jgi:transposase
MEIVLEGVLFVLTEGCSWRAINRPEAGWNSVYQYYRRWCNDGVWLSLLNSSKVPKGTLRFLDSTHVKVHCDGANPAGGQEKQGMGRTKGGLNTKIHAVVDNDARPVALALSAANEADVTVAPELLQHVDCGCVVADKAYDSNDLRAFVKEMGGTTCIPSRSNRLEPIAHSTKTYRKRHRVENFFQTIKRYRRVATRYDKLAETYFGFVCLAAFAAGLLR